MRSSVILTKPDRSNRPVRFKPLPGASLYGEVILHDSCFCTLPHADEYLEIYLDTFVGRQVEQSNWRPVYVRLV